MVFSVNYLILSAGVLMSSSAAVLVRLCNAPALIIATYRLGISSLVVLPLAVYKSGKQLVSGRSSDRVALICSGIFLAIHFAFWISSLDHTSVASSAVLVNTIPIFVGLGGWLILKEKITRRLTIGTAVAFAGAATVALVDWEEGHGFFGDLLAVGGAITVSGHLLISRRQRQRLDLLPYLGIVNTVSAVVLIALSISAQHDFFGYDDRTYLLFALLAIGPQLLGHTSFNYVLKRISPSVVALALLGEPIGAALLAYLVLDEVPSSAFFIGAPIIFSGILLATFPAGSGKKT